MRALPFFGLLCLVASNSGFADGIDCAKLFDGTSFPQLGVSFGGRDQALKEFSLLAGAILEKPLTPEQEQQAIAEAVEKLTSALDTLKSDSLYSQFRWVKERIDVTGLYDAFSVPDPVFKISRGKYLWNNIFETWRNPVDSYPLHTDMSGTLRNAGTFPYYVREYDFVTRLLSATEAQSPEEMRTALRFVKIYTEEMAKQSWMIKAVHFSPFNEQMGFVKRALIFVRSLWKAFVLPLFKEAKPGTEFGYESIDQALNLVNEGKWDEARSLIREREFSSFTRIPEEEVTALRTLRQLIEALGTP